MQAEMRADSDRDTPLSTYSQEGPNFVTEEGMNLCHPLACWGINPPLGPQEGGAHGPAPDSQLLSSPVIWLIVYKPSLSPRHKVKSQVQKICLLS